MKTIIIAAIIIGVISSGTLSYFAYQRNQCESSPEWLYDPSMNSIWNCLQFLDSMSNKQFLDLGKQEPSKLIISIGDPINPPSFAPITTTTNIAPLTTTLVFTGTQTITEISERSFEPTNYGDRQPDEIGTSWDLLPDSLRVRMAVVDQNNMDVIDRNTKSVFGRNAILFITQASCGDKIVEILYGAAVTVPIKNGTYTVLAKNSVSGLIPNESGEYVLDFASFFKQEIELPDDAIVLSSTSDVCSTEIDNYPLAYYDHVVFKLGEKENEN